MANSNLPFIGTTSYDIQEQLIDIASKYLEIDDINTLKTGLFGYITEGMSHIAQHGIFHRNALYNEFFLNTASIPKSIYNQAKILDYNIGVAKPSKITVNFLLKKNDIIRYGKKLPNGSIEFNISNKNKFYIKDFTFMLEYPVKIVAVDVMVKPALLLSVVVNDSSPTFDNITL